MKTQRLSIMISAINILKIRLLRNIFFLSLVVVIVLPLYDTLFIHPSFTKMLVENTRNDATRVARHLASLPISEKTELKNDVLQVDLLREAEKLKNVKDDFEITKLRFFSESGEIIFSSDPKEIGKMNRKKYFHEILAKGKIYAEVVQKDTESLDGQKMTADVVETYVPLISGDKLLGTFEIYYDITAKKKQLDTLLSRSSTIVFTLAFGLLFVIIMTLVKENKTIKERQRAEDALRKSEERFRKTTDLLPTIICEIDIDMMITYMNRAGFEIFGYSEADLDSGINIIDLINPDDKGRAAQRIDEIMQGAKLAADEYEMLGKDGSDMGVFVSFAPMHKEGKVVGMRASIVDVTEQKNLQARLQEAQKMEAIATLAGGIAHEFNNALGAVIPNIDILKIKFPDNKEMSKYVKPMYSSARRMAHLTSQMLAYARGGKYLPQNISLSSFVRDTLPLIKHTIEHSIHVETDLQDGVSNVEADLTQLQMVLLAVVVNATEAIEGKGYIRIITRSEEINEEFAKHHPDLKPGSYVCLRIEDNGSGMAEETRKKVFAPFFTTKFHGRGLGMAAVYGIVKNHDGFVLVDSELRKGTVVRIYLPTVV